MAKTVVVKPLGLVLRKAGLVSSEQVEKALQESLILPKCKIGEILAIRGWIKPQTADFFAEIWPRILAGKELQPLGQYLKAASLINEQEIAQILRTQANNSLTFGKIAVDRGLISQTTLDFFIEHLSLIKKGEIINVYPEAVALELDRIENYLLHNQKCEPDKLLQKYDKIRRQGTIIASGDLIEEELLASGIVVLEHNIIRIAKSIYAKKFNEDWLEKELTLLQPYNQIRLKMFELDSKADIPYKVINAVNNWSNHDPFLSQKIYQLVKEQSAYITPGQEELIVEELTYKYIIDNWEIGAAAKHFRRICDRIIQNKSCSAKSLFKTYKKIWQLKEINADNSIEQRELLRIGLIRLHNNRVSVSNPIYQAVFDRQWIEERLSSLEHPRSLMPSTSLSSDIARLPQASYSKKKHNILSIIGIIVSLIVIFFLFKLFKTQSRPNKLIEQGNSLLEKQQYKKALKIYNQLITNQYDNQADNNDLSLAYELRGQALLKLEQYNQAMSNYEQALAYNPHNLSAKQNMALVLSSLGQQAKANNIFETILQQPNISPQEKGITWWYWGKNFCRHNNLELANHAFSKALEFSSNYESEINLDRKQCSQSRLSRKVVRKKKSNSIRSTSEIFDNL